MGMSFYGIRLNNPLILILIGLLINNIILWSPSATEAQSLPGCPDRCGDLKVPYPFGMAKGCYLADNFFITCNQSFQPTPRAFLNHDPSLLLSNISLDGELSILQLYVAQDCHNQSYDRYFNRATVSLPVPDTVADGQNKLIAVGCDTRAVLEGYRGKDRLTVDCTSFCNHTNNNTFKSCSGIDGCCQSSVPAGLRNITVSVSSLRSASHPSKRYWPGSMACSYAFVVEESKFLFSNRSLVKLENSTRIRFEELENTEMLPLVINWAIGDERCEKAKKRSNFSCKENNIDECELSNPCENGKCLNLPGNWSCVCPTGYFRTETGCTKLMSVNHHSGNRSLRYIAVAGIGLGLLTLLVSSYVGVYWAVKKRNFRKVREKLFEKNGGLMLKQYLDASHSNTSIKIFTEEELAWATNNFHEKSIIEGSFGKTYKGILADRFVVIKQYKIVDPAYIEKFINAVIQLSKIQHKNVVQLLGCCLETAMPFLVCEFVKNGSLAQYFHQNGLESSLSSTELRLTIATDIARALVYLHYHSGMPVIHGNVTPSNIFLGEHYEAKLDCEILFCSNRIEHDLHKIVSIIGTIGFVDPEYILSGVKTKKSDVYSYGVVLKELLTGQKTLPFDWENNGERNLEMLFSYSIREDELLQLIVDGIGNGENIEVLKEVAILVKMCLRKEAERPTMIDVARKLQELRINVCRKASTMTKS
ncbi:hypothetical protein FNV43_RR06349 [Rhamnella rubrinervis]|uniref:Protein kinase domain-containing protein n=1 Tax=Rhamnella rubrinervis TaxID=2594499 RepID=A0A8K0HED0_9ROSA|nr:hypothetical protein FNV43_RR06349 [Rhamnella rubrinervis]